MTKDPASDPDPEVEGPKFLVPGLKKGKNKKVKQMMVSESHPSGKEESP